MKPETTESDETLAEKLALIEKRFHEVINGRCRFLEWAKDPEREMPKITEELIDKSEREWFSVPGMYGGFAYSLKIEDGEPTLTTESWCRVVEGSGERHVITPTTTELAEVGFI